MNLTMRSYQSEDDYWRIREFLRHVFLLNDRRELAWQVYRFDYWRWHGIENLNHGELEKDVFIWERSDRQIAAVLNWEGPGQAFLQVHPDLRTPELEGEMVAVAEQHLTIAEPDGRRKVWIYAHEHDDLRQDVLNRHGYTQLEFKSHHHRRSLSVPIPDAPVANGYIVRALGCPEELPARSWASWRAFHPDESDECYKGWEWYRNVQRAPLYRRDLDLVAVAPDGKFASFCTIWFDDVTRTGSFEPVGTVPEHQRRGLGRAVMYEGLRRLAHMGAVLATVGSEACEPFTFYTSIGFIENDLSRPWFKEFK